MAVVWGIGTWVWAALGAIFIAGAVVIGRVIRRTFLALGELKDSLELSGRLISSALESTREEATRAQEAMARLGRARSGGHDEAEPWSEW